MTVIYTGKERDSETGLDYFGARYFSGAQGRFTSQDWSAKPEAVPYSSLEDPQTLNLYSYVRNNPLAKADADGHCIWDLCIGEGIATYAAATAVVATAAYLMTPQGKESLRAAIVGTGALINKAVEGVQSLVTKSESKPGTTASPTQAAPTANTNPYAGPVAGPVTVVDGKGNAVPVGPGQSLTGSKDGKWTQVRGADGQPTGTRVDGGHPEKTHADPRAQEPHAHVPGKTNPDGTPWLPVNK